MKNVSLSVSIAVALTGSAVVAQKPDVKLPAALTAAEHQAKYNYTRVQPLLEVPMIDAAITKGPDGMYYLTGTTAAEKSGVRSQKSEAMNFAVNDGIRLWRSNDLKSWDDLGLVAPLSVVKVKIGDLGLLRTAADAHEMRGLLAPEIHFIKGAVYLTYSLKPCGTGLLKSKSGKPEGPYEDVGLITKDGTDASLFVDDDGTVYWVFGGGWVAKMNSGLTGLAEPPRLIQPAAGSKPNSPGSVILQVGQGGAFLFKKDGTYHLLAAGIQGRLGVPCYDTWVSTAKSLAGPWTQRKVAVAHGGQVTMFEGPGGQWYSTFSGVDSRAALRERAAVVPVKWVSQLWYFYPKNESWPWKDDRVITEAWGWEHARPLSELSYRDPFGVNGRDGYFYISGLHNPRSGHGDNINLVRGKDLTGSEPWEVFHLKGLETIQKLPWYAPVKEDGSKKGPFDAGGGFKVGLCKPFEAGGTFWVSLGAWGDSRTLRSTSGTMNGPWEIAAKDAAIEKKRVGFWESHPIQDYRGDMYGYLSSFLWVMNKDFTALDKNRKPATEPGYQAPSEARVEGYYRQSSDGSSLLRGDAPIGHPIKVDGKYLMMGGCGWHGDYRAFGTYDSCVYWAHEIGGPWHPNRSVLPHSGNSGIFQDNAGTWWNVVFGNDNFLPDTSRLHCLPFEIKWNGNGYDIGPKHKQETPYVQRPRALVPDANPVGPAHPVVTLPADIPLRSPSITPVTEGGRTVYYLTGTAGTPVPVGRAAPSPPLAGNNDGALEAARPTGSTDFHNNDGVYLWQSADLKTWTPLGKVFDLTAIDRMAQKSKARSWNNPLMVYFSPPDSLEPRYDRGIITPKFYKIGTDWWVVFSAGRQQVCLLKSQSGKPEGPYDLEGPKAVHDSTTGILDSGFHDSRTDTYMFAYDPSFFVEDDGSVYLVFGPGFIGKMQTDLGKGLAETPKHIQIEGRLYAGQGGCQIFKKDGRYHLLAANEWGDVIERTADNLRGPYRNARVAFAQAGASVFIDAQGQTVAVVSEARRK